MTPKSTTATTATTSPTPTPLRTLTCGLIASLSLLAGCAQWPGPSAAAAHDEGWRDGLIEQVGTSEQLTRRRGVDCRLEHPPAHAEALYARVSYTFQKVRLERIVPLSGTPAAPRTGQPVRFQVKSCSTPAQPL